MALDSARITRAIDFREAPQGWGRWSETGVAPAQYFDHFTPPESVACDFFDRRRGSAEKLNYDAVYHITHPATLDMGCPQHIRGIQGQFLRVNISDDIFAKQLCQQLEKNTGQRTGVILRRNDEDGPCSYTINIDNTINIDKLVDSYFDTAYRNYNGQKDQDSADGTRIILGERIAKELTEQVARAVREIQTQEPEISPSSHITEIATLVKATGRQAGAHHNSGMTG